MSWFLEFDEPIALPKGKALRDAGEHVAGLRKEEAALPHWLAAHYLVVR
jgi:hypothetical protein